MTIITPAPSGTQEQAQEDPFAFYIPFKRNGDAIFEIGEYGIPVAKTFANEKEFKLFVRQILDAHGSTYRCERNIREMSGCGIWCDRGSSAFVDFLSHKEKWFIEAKLSDDLQSFTRALGQCLYYREILIDYQPIILTAAAHSESASSEKAERIKQSLCDEHGIIYTNELRLYTEMRHIK